MKAKLFAGFSLCLALAFVCAPVNKVFADEVYVNVRGQYGPAGLWSRIVTNSAGSITEANSDSTWSIKATASMGRIDLDLTAIDGTYPYNGFAFANCHWENNITIQPGDPALLGTHGTAVFTYHLSGSQSLNRTDACLNRWQLDSEIFGTWGQDYGDGTYAGQHISDVPTYTVDRSFTFGGSIFEHMDLIGGVQLETHSGGEGELHLSLVAGSIAVFDNAGNPVAYSSTSSAGVARAAIFTNGVSYAGFSVTNNLGNQTALTVLGGTNTVTGSNETVAATFTPPPDTNQFVSDVVDFSGADTNLVALQLFYDPVAAIAHFGSETNVALLWFNQASNKWGNAVEGNSDGGLAHQFFQGAFNLATQFHLGNFGVDTVKHAVWAVLDHNSQFVVGVVAPPVRFAGISAGTNGTSLMLSGPPTGQFFIDYSSSLVAPGWTLLGMTTLDTNGTSIFNDATSVSANPQRFYRARQ